MGNNCVAGAGGAHVVSVSVANNLPFALELDEELQCSCEQKHRGFQALSGKFHAAPPEVIKSGETITFKICSRDGSSHCPACHVWFKGAEGHDLSVRLEVEAHGWSTGRSDSQLQVKLKGQLAACLDVTKCNDNWHPSVALALPEGKADEPARQLDSLRVCTYNTFLLPWPVGK
mgnify:CR=1 FL=1